MCLFVRSFAQQGYDKAVPKIDMIVVDVSEWLVLKEKSFRQNNAFCCQIPLQVFL